MVYLEQAEIVATRFFVMHSACSVCPIWGKRQSKFGLTAIRSFQLVLRSVSTNYSVFANSSIFEGKKLLEYSFEDGSNIFEFMPQCWLMR